MIGDFVHITPGAHLGGAVTVGDDSLVGIGASVLPRLKIGRRSVVGAGAVVTRDLPDDVVAIGMPARVQRNTTTGAAAGSLRGQPA